jgi:hypothetical protein
MPTTRRISDKGLAVFAFAVFHQLESGSRVREIVRKDGGGHQADPEAVGELQQLGMLAVNGSRVSFTEEGEAMVDSMIDSMREAAVVPSTDGE